MPFRSSIAAALLLFAATVPAPAADGPLIVAHRGGTGDAPENTATAIVSAVENGARAIWLTVQMSRDGVPVLYRPKDLSALSDRSGLVSSMTAADLAGVNVGFAFKEVPGRGRTDPSVSHAVCRDGEVGPAHARVSNHAYLLISSSGLQP